MENKGQLSRALEMLGEVLESRDLSFDLLVIGGGALLLRGLIERPTMDLDALARVENDEMLNAKPLPAPLVQAIHDVADTLDLPKEPKDEKDWLNGGPTFLRKLTLPEGFLARASVRNFRTLAIRVAAREDLVCLKLWAASDPTRRARRDVDIKDLNDINPTKRELQQAVKWCIAQDGRADTFELELAPILRELGRDPRELSDE